MTGCDIIYIVDYHHSVIVSQRDAAKFIRFAADFLKMSRFYKKINYQLEICCVSCLISLSFGLFQYHV